MDQSERICTATDSNFEQTVLKNEKAVLLDYWAPWCGPCRSIAPLLETLAESHGDRIQVAKINIDENPDTPAKYGVRGIPTLMLFKDGKVAATSVGAISQGQLTDFVESHL